MLLSSWRRIIPTAALCLLTLTASAQDGRDNAVGVGLSIQGTPRPGAPVKLMVSITNVGNAPLKLPARPGWDEAGGLEIVASEGNKAPRSVVREDSGRKPETRAGHTAMILQPGQSYAVMRSVPFAELAGEGGVANLRAVYRRPGLRDVTSAEVALK